MEEPKATGAKIRKAGFYCDVRNAEECKRKREKNPECAKCPLPIIKNRRKNK